MRNPKNLSDLILAVRDGCTVIQTYRAPADTEGRSVAWSLHPHGLSVEAKHVNRLMEVGALEPVGDGLFAEFSQQYRWVAGSEGKFSKRVAAKLEAAHA